jgi:hypothetical protein
MPQPNLHHLRAAEGWLRWAIILRRTKNWTASLQSFVFTLMFWQSDGKFMPKAFDFDFGGAWLVPPADCA